MGMLVLDADAKTERGEEQSMRASLREDEDQVGPASPSQTVVSCVFPCRLARLLDLSA
jgi:hypothetical protein